MKRLQLIILSISLFFLNDCSAQHFILSESTSKYILSNSQVQLVAQSLLERKLQPAVTLSANYHLSDADFNRLCEPFQKNLPLAFKDLKEIISGEKIENSGDRFARWTYININPDKSVSPMMQLKVTFEYKDGIDDLSQPRITRIEIKSKDEINPLNPIEVNKLYRKAMKFAKENPMPPPPPDH